MRVAEDGLAVAAGQERTYDNMAPPPFTPEQLARVREATIRQARQLKL